MPRRKAMGSTQSSVEDGFPSSCVANVVQYQNTSTKDTPMTNQHAQYSYNISLYCNSNPRRRSGGAPDLTDVAGGADQSVEGDLPTIQVESIDGFKESSGSRFRDPYDMTHNDHPLLNPFKEAWSAYDTDYQRTALFLSGW